jgi:hypothetical protein
MSQWAKLAEEQGEVVRKIKEAIKADPAAHTKEELDAAVAKLKELKAKADDPMNALEDPVTKVLASMPCCYFAVAGLAVWLVLPCAHVFTLEQEPLRVERVKRAASRADFCCAQATACSPARYLQFRLYALRASMIWCEAWAKSASRTASWRC